MVDCSFRAEAPQYGDIDIIGDNLDRVNRPVSRNFTDIGQNGSELCYSLTTHKKLTSSFTVCL